MKFIWHVYIDEEYRLVLSMFSHKKEWSKLPFSDQFSNMKLFATKNGAKKYARKLVSMFRDWFSVEGMAELPVREASDGGEFQHGVVMNDPNSETRRAVMSVWIKAVRRTVCK